jgi:SAM-dependent methyltransferase
MDPRRNVLDEQYTTDIHKVWHSSTCPPELVAALDDGRLGVAGRALDLGCGLGTELAHLAWHGFALTIGVDRSIAALQRAHHLHPDVGFVRGDVLRLPFPDSSFDVALDRGCFHYRPPPTAPAMPPRSGACCGPVGASCSAPASTRKASATTSPSRSSGGPSPPGAS